jgi:membrane-associated protease RseP (regulator of RpoE activity)
MPGEERGSSGGWTDTARIDAILNDPPTEVPPDDEPPHALRWKTSLTLFLLTVLSVFYTAATTQTSGGTLPTGFRDTLRSLPTGYRFAVPLLAILLTHELGHFIAARIHRVSASLPYFIPLPSLSPFGTMGAVISMPGRIRSRDALLDIGASGPLAGLTLAIPVLIVGLAHSPVLPNAEHGTLEGQCLLYLFLKRIVLGPIPEGYDVFLSPMAFAGWAGLLVTMLQLFPVAQLDGGHIAYALLGPRQDRYARYTHHALLLAVGYNVVRYAGRPLAQLDGGALLDAAGNASQWLGWYAVVHVIKRIGGRDHPPTEPGELHPIRRGIAVFSLALFVVLFMPSPWSSY